MPFFHRVQDQTSQKSGKEEVQKEMQTVKSEENKFSPPILTIPISRTSSTSTEMKVITFL